MHLEEIEIIGFKSFADRTKLKFVQGITAIVGPNGCGKSNISDAFRWVFGEQSAKSLRGSKMPDVIFAGTATRKPLNFAEVTITLGDVNGALPIEYNQVSITRRLHRSGESDYFINRHPVRLKDVHSLFLDSGMGKDAYSIFEQGKIDQVINFTPLERRYIFEEAAGILRFLHKKREALRKLESSDININRAKDIYQEVEKQIVVLEQQAQKAKIYKENKLALERLEKGLFLAKWDSLEKRVSEGGKKEEEVKASLAEHNRELEELVLQMKSAKDSLSEAEKSLRKQSEEVFKARGEREIKSRERQSTQERFKEALSKEKKLLQELEAMAEKRLIRQSEQQQILKQQKAFSSDLSAQESILKALREKVQLKEVAVSKMREQQQGDQQELMKLLKEESRIESEWKQVGVRLESTQERKEQHMSKLDNMSEAAQDFAHQIEEKQGHLNEVSGTIDRYKKQLAELESDLQKKNESIQNAQAALETVSRELGEAKARNKVLLKLREEMEGFSAGSKRLMQESANPKSPIHQKLDGLYELLLPKPGAEAALASALKSYTHTLVVKTKSDFQKVVAYAGELKLKDFSLLCLEEVVSEKRSSSGPSDSNRLLDQVGSHLLADHFLSDIYIAPDRAEAAQLKGRITDAEVWSSDGIFFDRRQVRFFHAQGEQNLFAREAELKTLEKHIKDAEANKEKLETELKILQQQRMQMQAARQELDKTIRREEMKLVEVNFTLQRMQADGTKAANEVRMLEKEIAALAEAAGILTLNLENLRMKHLAAKEKSHELQMNISGIQKELEELSGALKQEQRVLQEKDAAFHRIADENRKALHNLHVIEVKDLESLQQEGRLEEEIQASREMQAQFSVKSGEYELMLKEVEKVLAIVVEACSGLEKEVAQRKGEIDKLENKIYEGRAKVKKREEQLHQCSLHRAQIDSLRQSLETELQERYRLTIDDLRILEVAIDKPIEHTEKQIRTLRHEIESAGDINMTSIEEFEKHKSRYEFLNTQLDDLNKSRQELIEIITKLDTESRKVFKETFDLIKANFKKNFKILFNGGEADLHFTEAADILEAGIDIIAKPPGKQMRSIHLMSGGEKCLTAMALLFAVFEVRPSPFCILDEIDAPLDDSNIERFVNVVKQFIDRCQFIIITHNKRTMAIADVLFGVSMEEKGVSKLLTMEFAKHSVPEPLMN